MVEVEEQIEIKQAAHIVTIKSKIPLFKGEEQANSIELITLEEFGNELVSQKDLYKVGDKAIFIEPDYSLPDTSLFEDFHRPYGDPKKCILGNHGRIKAKKFTLHRGDGLPVYSYGILLPYNEVCEYFRIKEGLTKPEKFGENYLSLLDLTKELEITKWEEPENLGGSGLKTNGGNRKPSDLYKTDEENINNLWNSIKFPTQLTGRVKEDGSSITLWYRNGKSGICSREMSKSLTIKKVVGRRKKTILEYLLFWTKSDLNIYHLQDNDDMFVVIGKPYLDKLVSYCQENNIYGLALRGELNGKSARGSGNKNNPSKDRELNIRFYGVDDYTQQAVKLNENQFHFHLDNLGFDKCEEVFSQFFTSREDLENKCEEYFTTHLVEGIVVRNFDHSFSAKYMCKEYDSKK